MKTKRPIVTWLIAVWVFIQHWVFLSYPMNHIARLNEIPRETLRPWKGIGVLFVIVLCVALIQMKNRARFFAAACLSLAVFMLGRLSILILFSPATPPPRLIAQIGVSFVVNVLAFLFLVRPSYGRLCDAFQQEKIIVKKKRDGTYISVDDLEPIGD